MVAVDALIGMGIGQVLALGARDSLIHAPRTFAHPAFRHGLAFISFVYIPAATSFLLCWPALDWAYLVEPSALLTGVFVTSVFAAFCIGFWSTHRLLRAGLHRALGGTVLLVAILIVALVVGLWDRVTTVAPSVEAYVQGLGVPFLESEARFTSAGVIASNLVAFSIFWPFYRRKHRKAS